MKYGNIIVTQNSELKYIHSFIVTNSGITRISDRLVKFLLMVTQTRKEAEELQEEIEAMDPRQTLTFGNYTFVKKLDNYG